MAYCCDTYHATQMILEPVGLTPITPSSSSPEILSGGIPNNSRYIKWLCCPKVGDGHRTLPGVADIFQASPGYILGPTCGWSTSTKVPLAA